MREIKKTTILFVNTYQPVVPLYHDVFRLLEKRDEVPEALVSASDYRSINRDGGYKIRQKRLWVPKIVAKNKRWCALMYWAGAFVALIFVRYKRIVFLSQPPLFYIAGSVIAKLKRKPYCMHVMDLYPDLLFKYRYIKNVIITHLLNRAAIFALNGADTVIVLGRCMERILIEKGVDRDRISIVENWPEATIPEYIGDGGKFRVLHQIADKFVVMYSGNMGRFHMFDTLLEVAKRMSSRDDVIFIFIGEGVRRREIQAAIEEGGKNILLLDHQSNELYNEALAAGDVHYVSLREGYEGLMVPSKFYSILAIGKPTIYEGDEGGEVAQVIAEESCGSIVSEGEANVLEKILLGYLEHPDELRIQGEKARQAYTLRYERTRQANRYVEVVVGSKE